jgi:DeoD family purine-nucleoside phosphorylase
VPRAPIHLQPTARVAERALLPGDPGRALLLAQALLDGPKMFNHHRGLWGYTGPAADGELLTIQATGMGGPSAAIVLEELADLGVARAVRVGTCGALSGELALGDLVVAREALAEDGTSRALGCGPRVAADAALTEALAGDVAGLVVSTDLFYEVDGSRESRWRSAGALAVEMEAAALFAVGARRGVAVGCVLAVSDVLGASGRSRISEDALRDAVERLGVVGAGAFGARSASRRAWLRTR